MLKNILPVIIIITLASGLLAQEAQPVKSQPKQDEPSKVYWGGELGLSFGSYFMISVVPLVGYKVTPKFHLGGKLGFSYVEDTSYEKKITSFNYGGSIFARYLLVKGLYVHSEYVYWSYKFQTENLEGERTWVPFLLVGAGYIYPVSANTSIFVEALWDIIHSEKSPYSTSEVFVKFGVGVGL